MADASRQEKLASAKRKLKQFQQRKTPSNTPSPRKSNSHDLSNISKDLSFESSRDSSFQKQITTPQPTTTQTGKTDNVNINGSNQDFIITSDNSKTNTRSSPHLDMKNDNQDDSLYITKSSDANDQVIENMNFSPAEKIKQISNQLNGLITKDILINADEQILNQIEAVEKRNSELEDNLQSYKRSNQQLTNQLNEQRKHLIQYQEKLRKQKSDPSPNQLQELRAAKEQLEVHIQTIGILVSDKTELQENLRKAQKKLQSKDSENEDVNNRLQAVRQRVVELERNIANVQMTCDKYQQNNKDIALENEKIRSKLFTSSKDKEELAQQTSELQEMLAAKVSSYEALETKFSEISSKLKNSELVTQQLSVESKGSDSLTQLHLEKETLQTKITTQAELLEKLSSEKGELLERHHEQIEHLEERFEEQRSMREDLETQKYELELKAKSNQDMVSKLERQIAEMLDKEAEQQSSATHVAATEIEKLNDEKKRTENELDIQINENRRVSKLILAQDERIQELESAIARLGEDAVDRVSLLEDMQSDKETISRAMQQNKALKDQLEELQKGFVKITNTNAGLTTGLQKEQHLNQELASKLSDIGVELEEKKAELQLKESASILLENELNEFKQISQNQKAANESENAAMKLTIDGLQADLELQIHLNEKLRHLEASSELTDKLHLELQSAQDTINLLSSQNAQLREAMQERVKEEEEQHVKSENLADDTHNLEDSSPFEHQASFGTESDYNSHSSSLEEADGHTQDQNQRSRQNSINEDLLDSYRNAIAQLEDDRDGLYEVLQKEREKSEGELTSLREHMEMQLQQQLKQQIRQVQEHYQQQIHEQQLKTQSLQTTIDNYKNQESLIQADVNENGINYETLKIAFQQLQIRFKKLLDEKVNLSDSLQEMEHNNMQLASETETIGEYVNLYRTQRLALKEKFYEKDRLISQLSSEHGRMQMKISKLQELVMQTIAEKTSIEQEKKQMQDLVNKRLEIQSGAEREHEIPKLNLSNDSMYEDTIVSHSFAEHEDEVNHESRPRTRTDSQSCTPLQDGKTQKILQIFEQLNDTGEGYQKGWLSPVVRRREFTPCKHCSGRTFAI